MVETVVQTWWECGFCEETFETDVFTEVQGWWASPMRDIAWGDAWDGLIPPDVDVFCETEPKPGPAWKCPNGCVHRTRPQAQSDHRASEG